MFDWALEAAKQSGQFAGGFGKGVWDFGKDTVTGVADLAQAGYKLSTDADYREHSWETAKQIGSAVKQGAQYAIENPKAAAGAVRDAASSAYAKFQAERAEAAAAGRLAEFDGHLAGRILPELIPAGALAKLGKASELAKLDHVADAAKLAKAGTAAEEAADASRAARAAAEAVEAGGRQAGKQGVTATQECPLKKAAEAARKKADEAAEAKNGKPSKPCSGTKTCGEPVSMASGEELLELTDFVFDGPLGLTWRRLYRSGQSGENLQLGYGWLTPLDEWLDLGAATVRYHDCEGRALVLPLPDAGDYCVHPAEQIRLYRAADHFRLTRDDGPDRIFAASGPRCELQRLQNESGHAITLQRDAAGVVRGLSTSWGKGLLLQREGRHISAIVPARVDGMGWTALGAPLVRYVYDAAGDLVAVQDRLDVGERYAYQNHLIVRRTLASGLNFHFEWDAYGASARCLRSHGDGGWHDTRFEWTDSGISRAIDAQGGVTTYMHDKAARLLWETSPEGRTTRYSHNADGLLAAVTQPGGQVTRFEYDGEGRLLALTDPSGARHMLEYDAAGRTTAIIDPLGHCRRRRYDAQGRLCASIDALGGETRFAYNEMGLPAVITNALGQSRRLLWDEQARLIADIGFDGVRRSFQYDAEDRIAAAVSQDKLTTKYRYDAAGRLIFMEGPDGTSVSLAYDAAGQLTTYTDAAGHTTRYRYADGLAEPSARVDANGHILSYRYDAQRRVIALVNAKGEQYRLAYDRDGNLIEQTGFDGRRQAYRYDTSGRLIAYGQAGLESWLLTRFERDASGRLLKKIAGQDISEYAYDAAGRLNLARNAHSQLQFQYDANGRLIAEHQTGQAISHEYDASGRNSATVAPDGRRIEYQHNAAGRVQAVLIDGQVLTRHRYDEFGQETDRQQGDLLSHFDYDPAGRLLRQQAVISGSGALRLDRRYGYDAAGKLAALTDLRHGESRYIYDPAERLVRVDGLAAEQFAHDPAGNYVGASLSAGQVQGDRLKFFGDRHFAYDAAGNLTQESRGKEGKLVSRYEYDAENRLIAAHTPAGSSTYQYDPLGRRIAKQSGQASSRFVWNGARLLCEITADCCALYLYEPGSFRPLARQDRRGETDTTYHFHLDHLGAVRELSDARGHIVWSARYRAYGALALADVKLVDNPLRWQGQYHDTETGLHYNLFRYYDPDSGRFIHQDPIGLAGGENAYRFADNPVNWIDPLGLTCRASQGGSGVGTSPGAPSFRFNAVENPGPLAAMPGNPAANFFGGRYNEVVLTEDLTLYRGGEAGAPLGQWFTREAPDSVAQIRIDSAVKSQWIDPKTGILTGSSPIDTVFEVKIPKGATIYEGPVGYQGGINLGGPNTNQVFVPAPWNIKGVQVVGGAPIR
ncbi:MAG: RHS repeat protein [Rhodocyclaceae bacterium]|nr:RHS repeat protein [Rhodocyclaceae bacterium]